MAASLKTSDRSFTVAAGVIVFLLGASLPPIEDIPSLFRRFEWISVGQRAQNMTYNRDMPLVFIGGMPRSGTTLLRAILDAHSAVRCGEETHIIPRILGAREVMFQTPKEIEMLNVAGVTEQVLQSAYAAFILEVIVRHSDSAARLCNKDPFTMRHAQYVSQLFPNAKFLWVVRDGRAVCHSILSRHILIQGYGLKGHSDCLTQWNRAVEVMLRQCRLTTSSRCLIVYYEQLVSDPRFWLEHITEFLELPWEDALLQHELYIGKPGGVSLSPYVPIHVTHPVPLSFTGVCNISIEKSSDQVIRPIYTDARYSWVDHIPDDVQVNISQLAPMLQVLGYDPRMKLGCYDFPKVEGSPNVLVDLSHVALRWLSFSKELLLLQERI